MAEALYRKYRPRTFAEVVGQDTIERTLKNAVAQDKVSHAYLFCGPRGTGKTTSARLLAKALLCERGPTPEPDGTCADCLDIARGMHPDVYELDAASRTGVDNVREEIIGRVAYAPTRGRFKIYIIDEVHMLSVAAFNALLKTLEEPPAHVVFVLCTTDPQKVPETIQSRCQRFDFRRIGAEEIAGRLAEVCRAEGAAADPEALALIARHAKGGMRDALTALEACLAHDGGAVTLEGARNVVGEGDVGKGAALLEAVAVRDVAAAFAWVDAASDAGVDLSAAATGLAADIRDLYVMAVVGGPRTAENRGGFGLAPARVEALTRVSGAFGADRAARALAVLGDLITELKTSANPRLSFEIALVRLARPAEDMTLEALAERVEALEMGRAGAVPVAAAAAAPAVAAPVAPATAPVAPAPAPATAPPTSPRHSERSEGSFPAPAQQRPAVQQPVQQRPVAHAPVPERPAPRQVPFQRGAASPAAAPAPAAPVPAQPPAEPITADQMYRAWPMVLAQLKKLSPSTRAFFNSVTPSVSAQGTLEVLFPAGSDTTFQVAQKESNASQFAAALTRAFGRPVPFVLRQAKPAPASRPQDSNFRPVQQVPGIARPAVSAAPMPSAPFSPALNRAVQQAQAPAAAQAPASASRPAPAAVPATPATPVTPAMQDAPEPEYAPYDDADFDAEAAEAAFAVPSTRAGDGTDKMEDFFSAFGGASFEQFE